MNKVIGHEYLTFQLGREEYGIDITSVQEIKGYEVVTHIPGVANFIKGIINLRGIIVPIIDLRIRLGIGEPVYSETTAVIIVVVSGKFYGVIVDSVSDVISFAVEQIKPPPELGGDTIRTVIGLGSVEGRMVILMDVALLLADNEGNLVVAK